MRTMADTSTQPKLTPEQRRAATGQFERANQVLKGGDHEYGLRLLLECCKIDPANLIYRQALRQGQRARYNINQAIPLWEQVRKAVPDDLEAQRKGKDLAASATIAKGRYTEALQGSAPSPMQEETETASDQPAMAKTDEAPSAASSDDRNPREVANLLERIKANPKNANVYLQLATVYRKAEQFDKAKDTLQQRLQPTGNSFDIT